MSNEPPADPQKQPDPNDSSATWERARQTRSVYRGNPVTPFRTPNPSPSSAPTPRYYRGVPVQPNPQDFLAVRAPDITHLRSYRGVQSSDHTDVNHTHKALLLLILLFMPLLPLAVSLGLQSTPPDNRQSGRISADNLDADYRLLIERADERYKNNQLKDAMALLSTSVESQRQKRNEIADELVRRARNAYPNKLELAILMVSSVPSNTPAYNDARSLQGQWNSQLDRLTNAEYAVSQQRYQDADAQLAPLRGTEIERTERFRRISDQVASNLRR